MNATQQIERRLKNAMQQVAREIEAAEQPLEDCTFTVIVSGGQIVVEAAQVDGEAKRTSRKGVNPDSAS